jgi:hypothetical protein
VSIANGDGRDFGSTDVGHSNNLKFLVKNIGNASLTGLKITKNGANAADFSIAPMPSATVAPNGTTSFGVSFTPSSPGQRIAAIHLASNDSDENPFDITFKGTGIVAGGKPKMTVVDDAAEELFSGMTYPFGDVSGRKNFGIFVESTGTADLVFHWAQMPQQGPGALTIAPFPDCPSGPACKPVAPNNWLHFDCTYSWGGTGAFASGIRIYSNDPNQSLFEIHFTATGTAPKPPSAPSGLHLATPSPMQATATPEPTQTP